MHDIYKFRKWLDRAYDHVRLFETHPDPSEWHYGEAARVLAEASERCKRLGEPELTVLVRQYPDGSGFCLPDEAMDAIAKMLAWCREHETLPDVMTVQQAAEYVSVSEKTIHALCDDRSLPHQRFGKGRGTIRIKRSDLDKFTRQNRVQVASPKDYLSD